jgi:hypothetical protein
MVKKKVAEKKIKVKEQKASAAAWAMADKKLLNPPSAEENNPKRDAWAALKTQPGGCQERVLHEAVLPEKTCLSETSMAPEGKKMRPSAEVDTRVVYCGDNPEQLRKLPDGCVDLIYIDPSFNSNRNYEVFIFSIPNKL